MPNVPMPRLSDSMREGAVSVWLVEDGASVTRGQELLEVETDKATMTYEAEHAGTLRILVTEGVNVAVGDVIATIGDGERTAAPAETTPPAVTTSTRRPDLSPLLRRLAREHGVDVEALTGSGPRGQIQRSDILAASSAPAAAPAPMRANEGAPPGGQAPMDVRRTPLSRTQRLVAARLTESQRAIPDFWATTSVDVTRLLELRADLKASGSGTSGSPAVPTFNDFVIRASALTLVEHPDVNAHYDDGHIVTAATVNVGIAVSTDNGLLVPVITQANRLSLGEIARQTRSLVDLARAGKIGMPALEGASFTVSNLGAFGVRSFAPILSGSQAAILGVGAATPTCVPVNGEVRVRSIVELTLTSDHRIVYGVAAARFLQTLKALLEAPGQLLAPSTP